MKRRIAIILFVLSVFSVFCGCFDEEDTNTTPTPEPEQVTAAPKETPTPKPSRFDAAFYHTWKNNKEFIMFDYDKNEVVRFYQKNNDFYKTPDYGTYTENGKGEKETKFEVFKDPVVFIISGGTLSWIRKDGSVMTEYTKINVSEAEQYLKKK